MAETQLTDSEVQTVQDTQAAGESAAGAGLGAFQYSLPNESYTKKGTRQEHKLLTMFHPAHAGRVFKDGTITFGVDTIEWLNGDVLVTKPAQASQALTNNQTNYIFYLADGTLTVNTTGFPVQSVTSHIALATIATGSASAAGTSNTYAFGDITDKRERSLFTPGSSAAALLNALSWQGILLDELAFQASEPVGPTVGDRYLNTSAGTGASSVTAQSVTKDDILIWNGTDWTELTPSAGWTAYVADRDEYIGFETSWKDMGSVDDWQEMAAFFGATDISGAEAETLTDTSNADALHVHSSAGLSGITEADMAAAATQTMTGVDTPLVHNNKRVLRITMNGNTTVGAAGQAIANGSLVGQLLTIMVVETTTTTALTITDDAATAKTNLKGNWISAYLEDATNGYTYLTVTWDGTLWQEIIRYDGFRWTATGAAAHGEGEQGVASGDASHVENRKSIASGNFGSAGGDESLASLLGEWARASGNHATNGDAQTSGLTAWDSITHSDANWHTLLLDGSGATVLPDILADSAWTFEVQIVGTTQGGGSGMDVFSYLIEGCIENDNGTTALKGYTVTTIHEDDTDFDAQVAADDTNDSLLVQVKDSTSGGAVVRWMSTIKLSQTRFP